MEDGVLSGYWSKIKTVDYNRNQIFIVLLYKKITSKLSGLKHSKCLLSHSAFGVGIPSGLPGWFWLCHRVGWLDWSHWILDYRPRGMCPRWCRRRTPVAGKFVPAASRRLSSSAHRPSHRATSVLATGQSEWPKSKMEVRVTFTI